MSRILEIQSGELLKEVQLEPVSRLDLIKYAGASGDFNPIHTIDAEAESAGLPGIIAHGMWAMGNLSKIFTPYLEEGFIKDYSVRFSRMVFLGDSVALKATFIKKEGNHLNFDVVAVNQHNDKVLTGSLVFYLGIPDLC